MLISKNIQDSFEPIIGLNTAVIKEENGSDAQGHEQHSTLRIVKLFLVGTKGDIPKGGVFLL